MSPTPCPISPGDRAETVDPPHPNSGHAPPLDIPSPIPIAQPVSCNMSTLTTPTSDQLSARQQTLHDSTTSTSLQTQPMEPSSSPVGPTSVSSPRAPGSRPCLAPVAVPPHHRGLLVTDDPASATSDSTPSIHNDVNAIVLDDRHPTFLHNAEEFLVNVSEGGDWKVLLSRYVEFERLASQVSFLSSASRNY